MDKNYQFYMDTNVDRYVGQWIAICNEQIIASGTDVKKVFTEAKQKFPKEKPFITRVPDKETMIFCQETHDCKRLKTSAFLDHAQKSPVPSVLRRGVRNK